MSHINNKYGNILFCTADPTKNAGSISDYFINNSDRFIGFHFFPGYSSQQTYIEIYEFGKKVEKKQFNLYAGKNKLLKNIYDLLYFSYVLLFIARRGSYVIINAPFFCTPYLLFEILKSLKFVLWIGDYYPQKNFPMNIYHAVVDFYNRHIRYVIYLSPPLEKIYGPKRSTQKFSGVISLGIKNNNITRSKKIGKKIIIGFIGIIRKQQGLELAMDYLAQYKDVFLEVVGDGYELNSYKKLSKDLGLGDRIKFYGRVENVDEIFKKWDIGMALYENKTDNLSLYCEPTKIKQYLSYGLPAITTRATYFHKELVEYNAGVIVEESAESIHTAVLDIKKHYNKYRNGAFELMERYEYSRWYDKKLMFLRK